MEILTQLMQGDCLERMKEIPDESIDMVLCDLPYGMTKNKWDSMVSLDRLWDEYHRITKPTSPIVLHCQQPFTTELIASNIKEFKYLWYWDKHLKTNFLNAKKQPLRQIEEIAVFYKKQCRFAPPPQIWTEAPQVQNEQHKQYELWQSEQRRFTDIQQRILRHKSTARL